MKRQQAAAVIDKVIAALVSERKKRGLSHEKVADMAGIHRTTIGLIEARKREPTLLTLLRMAAALECDLGKIISKAAKDHA